MGRTFVGFDTETTGLKAADGDKIIEVALLTYDLDSGKLIDQYVQRINPGRAIDPKAQEVHKIDISMLIGMPDFATVAPEIKKRLEGADFCIAHNLNFDAEFLAVEFAAAGIPLAPVPSVDTMDARWATFNGKSPNLGELCFSVGVEYDPSKAHGAEYDVDVMSQCYMKGLKLGFFQLPPELMPT